MVHSESTRRKLSEMRKGKNNPFYGKHHTAAAKLKMANWTRRQNAKREYDLNPVSVRVPKNKMWLGYLAGMVDADGSIRSRRGRPFVAVYNTNKRLMGFLCQEIGGKITGTDMRGRVPSYAWQVQAARDVYLLCRSLAPILLVKDGDALTVIDFLEKKYGKDKLNG